MKSLVIGDSCLDEYNIGIVERLSPEAPVPVIHKLTKFQVPGMAANVNLNIKKLGLETDLVTNTEVIYKSRYIDKKTGQHLLRVDIDEGVELWNKKTPEPIETYDLVVISDYNKGFLNYDSINYIIKNTNCSIFIDSKKQELEYFAHDRVYVKINELEYKMSKGFPNHLIVTLGEYGAMYKNKATEKHFNTKKVEVMDVCGCGDTFLSALAVNFKLTSNIESSIIFANKAATITAGHRGNYAPSIKEIENA